MRIDDIENILSNETLNIKDMEVSAGLHEKIDAAFQTIKDNETGANGMNKSRRTHKNFLRRPIVIIVAAILVLTIGTTVFAAATGLFSNGIKKMLNTDDEQLAELEKWGLVETYPDSEGITINGVTFRLAMTLTDGQNAYIAFTVTGYAEDDRYEPACVTNNDIFIQDNDIQACSIGSGFFNSYGKEDERLNEIGEYLSTADSMEYIVQITNVSDNGSDLFGKKVSVSVSGFGQIDPDKLQSRTEINVFSNVVSGPWEFEVTLPEGEGNKIIRTAEPEQNVEILEGVIISSVEISYTSIRLVYSRPDSSDDMHDYLQVTKFVTKEGEIINLPATSVSFGHSYGTAHSEIVLNMIIDPQNISCIYVTEYNPKDADGYMTEEIKVNIK